MDGGIAVDFARVVGQLSGDIEGDFDILNVGVINADRGDQSEEGDPQIVLGLNEGRLGIGKLYLRLEHVEAWHSAGIVSALLVGDLGLVKGHLLLIGDDECAVENDLVELLDDRGNRGVNGLAQRVVGNLFGEFSGLDICRGSPAVIDKLASLKLNIPALVINGGVEHAV